jgi:NAD(P) transhydrogenase subunit alpha
LEAQDAQTSGGYAKAQSEEFYRKQQEFLAKTAQNADVVITTALVPGKRAPVLLSEDGVKGMKPSSVIVDLAAEQGGNCALTEPGKTVIKHGVTIHGLFNLPSLIPSQSSLMYSRNISAFLALMLKDGKINIDLNDDLISGSLAAYQGEILFPKKPAPVAAVAGGKTA